MNRLTLTLLAAALAVTAWAGLGASDAAAKSGIKTWTVGVSTTQAGGHPDVTLKTTFSNRTEFPTPECNCDDVRIIRTKFPTGFIGNPHAIPKCTLAEFGLSACPPEAQVGVTVFLLGLQVPVYNMTPHPDEAGLLGFKIPAVDGPSFIILSGRTESDYGLNAESSPIFHLLPISELHMYLWGVPADASHDKNRWPNPQPVVCPGFKPYPEPCFAPVDSNVPAEPYLQNPTKCAGDLSMGLDLEYYDGAFHQAEAPWPATTGCDQLTFNPSLTALPTTNQADTPSGLDVNLKVPQIVSPTTPTPSAIRATTVRFPEGLTINPNAADGRVSCSDAQGAFGTRAAADCPEQSKVGTVRLVSSALPGPLFGGIYLGQPLAGDTYRIYLTASGFATNVKLAGTVRPNPDTGRLEVSFGASGSPDLPQSPFSEFDMHFFGSERGLLATPEQCGTYPITSEFTPWNDALPNQFSTSYFTIDSGPGGSPCPPGAGRPFNPTVTAGSADNSAGHHSSFAFRVSRNDGDQNIRSLTVSTPEGFAASLKGVPYCSEASLATLASGAQTGLGEQSNPACAAASQIGTASATVGAGSQPLHTPGKVYLGGPYKGSPLSLVVVVPAVSGPYDLGNVVVRSAVSVNRETAEITTASDSIPQILDGVPLRLRNVLVNLDRPNFALNPTSCNPLAVGTQLFAVQGAIASSSSHFQVSNCSDLGFKPKLRLKLGGATKRTGHPSVRATLAARAGDANIDRVMVALPASQQLDNANISQPCTRPQLAADRCPANTVLGSATATTPILDAPLSGQVYLVVSNNELPDLLVRLRGQVDVDLRAKIETIKGRMRTTFQTVPDVPVSSFDLMIDGGKRGLLVNNTNICRSDLRASVQMRGQNNRRFNSKPRVSAPCGKERRR